jgi:hypothetical protein
MTDYKDEIRERMGGVGDIESLLREYGGTSIQVLDGRQKVVDFNTPFPGDQPIRSGLEIEDGMVTRGTIRYGVLDKEQFRTGPHGDPKSLRRLRRAVESVPAPGSLGVNVGFGDANRVPRPHIRLGWRPDEAGVQLIETGPGGAASVADTVRFIEAAGEQIRDEFEAEYVKPVPGVENAPLAVSEFVSATQDTDAENIMARPSSRDGYEITFTYPPAVQSRAIVTDDSDVLQYDINVPSGFGEPDLQQWVSKTDRAGVPESAFVTVGGDQKEVSYRSSIADETLSVEEAVSQIRSLSI